MHAQGLRLFYNRGLHLLLAKSAVSGAAQTSQGVQFLSLMNNEMVKSMDLNIVEILLKRKEGKRRPEEAIISVLRRQLFRC